MIHCIIMIEIKSQVKKWGNSLAIVLPKEKIKGTNIKLGKNLTVMINEENIDLKKEFGSLKNILKKPTKKIMAEIDEGWE